jgi:dTDP-4-dehydrorhamnose reductase
MNPRLREDDKEKNNIKIMSKTIKVLILGAQGMLGQDMAEVFSDYEPILFDRKNLDLTDFSRVKEKLHRIKPDLIINCAGYTDVEKAEDNKDSANLINGDVVGDIAQICHDLNMILVHISTEYVFDGEKKEGYDENDETNSQNAYGQSKALGEKLLIENGSKYYLVRTSWIYGHHLQKGKERGVNFVDRMIELAEERDELNLVNDQFSKPTYTKDLCEAIKKLVEEKHKFGTYHLVNESKTTPLEFAQEIFKIKKIDIKTSPISYQEYPSKVDRPINAILNNNKFPKLRSWKEALKDYLSN